MSDRRQIKDFESLYTAVLFSVGFALNLEEIKDRAWFTNPILIFRWPGCFQVVSLAFVYCTIISSAYGFYVSTRDKPIRAAPRFYCTNAIMITYFLFFLKFDQIGSELVLLSVIFLLFIVWDRLKEIEYAQTDQIEGVKARDRVTVFWFIVFASMTIKYFIMTQSPWLDLLFVTCSFLGIVLYRIHKSHPDFLFSQLLVGLSYFRNLWKKLVQNLTISSSSVWVLWCANTI
ncbi:MAG: hypothetical protein ABSF63_00315 [Candidatus Bathyarchaeia archaeon]|jgi:hypothetical protein